jgi:Holliday junction resolvase RusA-like endonuclease
MTNNTIKFKVPAIPPSYNKSFQINFNYHTTFLSKEAKGFKDKVKMFMPVWQPPVDSMFEMNIKIQNCWFFLNGNLQKKDVQNLDKLICDACFEKIGIDDNQIQKLSIEKVRNKESFTEIEIKVVGTVQQFKDTLIEEHKTNGGDVK